MTKYASTELRPMNAGDLELVLSWRNHPEVRRFMYTQHEITPEEHVSWFERAIQDDNRRLLIFENDTIKVGFININQISRGGIGEWGFYISPDAPKGSGLALGKAALRYSFESYGLHKLCGQALDFNERSIRFHQKLGFKNEGILRQQHFDGQNYHDVVCFGLLATEWQQES